MLVSKTKLRFDSDGAFTCREAIRVRWENVSRQAPPFQGRRPPPSRRGRGEKRSNEDHLSLQTAALVLRRCLGWLSRVLLLIVLLCVLFRAAVDVLLGSLLCVLSSIILLTPPGGRSPSFQTVVSRGRMNWRM